MAESLAWEGLQKRIKITGGMMRRKVITLLGLFFLLLGCEKKPIAVVDGIPITEKMFNTALNERVLEHKAQGVEVNPMALKQAVLDELIAETLIIKAGEKQKISASDEEVQRELDLRMQGLDEKAFKKDIKDKGLSIKDLKKRIKNKIMVVKFIDQIVPPDSVTEEEIKAYYKASTTPFLISELVLVRFIQTKTKEESIAIIKEMKEKGIGFDTMADGLQRDNKAAVSAYVWVQTEMFGQSITAPLRNLKKGSYGGPYSGKEAYYIFMVKDRQSQRPETFDEAREKIRGIIYDNKKQAGIAHWIADRKSKANIVIK